jgi:uncharacterized SAM-binding protein YcdF (DUF218 family)
MLFPVKWALRLLVALMALIILYLGVTAVQVYLTSRQQSTAHGDAILVFGTAEYNGVPSPDLQARLNQALALFHEGRAPLIAVTGGKAKGDVYTEAEVSVTYLHRHGVPFNDLIAGSGSDTYENVQSVAAPLTSRSVKSVLVVTDPFHEDRAMAVASTFSFSPSPTPTEHSPIMGWAVVPYFIRETFAVGAGRLIGYGTLSSLVHP